MSKTPISKDVDLGNFFRSNRILQWYAEGIVIRERRNHMQETTVERVFVHGHFQIRHASLLHSEILKLVLFIFAIWGTFGLIAFFRSDDRIIFLSFVIQIIKFSLCYKYGSFQKTIL